MRIKALWTVFWILVLLFDHERRLISQTFGTWVALALLYFDDALHGLRGVPGYGSMYNDIYCIKVAKRCMEAGASLVKDGGILYVDDTPNRLQKPMLIIQHTNNTTITHVS
jgi:hypothetical protein